MNKLAFVLALAAVSPLGAETVDIETDAYGVEITKNISDDKCTKETSVADCSNDCTTKEVAVASN